MIKDRPHRLDLIYLSQPLYFVTVATCDRKTIPSLHRAQLALERYGRCAIAKFNVALGRYVMMPDHVHLFVRGRHGCLYRRRFASNQLVITDHFSLTRPAVASA